MSRGARPQGRRAALLLATATVGRIGSAGAQTPAPEPASPVVVRLDAPRPATLFRVEGGVDDARPTWFSPVCAAPCNAAIVPKGEQFFVAPTDDPRWATERFRLDGMGPVVRLSHRPGSRGGVVFGYAMIGVGVAALIAGAIVTGYGASLSSDPAAREALVGSGGGGVLLGLTLMAGGLGVSVEARPKLTSWSEARASAPLGLRW